MRAIVTLIAAGALIAAVAPAPAQSLESRISAVGDGSVRFSFASRPGVCGDGRGSIGTGGNTTIMRQYSSGSGYGESREWCVPGPVLVVLTLRAGAVERARVFVGAGDSSADARDLGVVADREAVDYLLALAPRSPGRVGEEVVLGAVLADSVTPWPALFSIARSDAAPRGTRESAAFWLGRAAAAAVNHRPLLGGRDDDDSPRGEVRNAAIFALSQQPRDEGVPALIRVVRTSRDPAARDKALFWLSQSGDERAMDLFQELLEVR